MAELTDLFDTYNLDDVPMSLKSELKQDCFADEIIALFRLVPGRELSVDAITVAHYRKYTKPADAEPKSKKQIMAKLYALGKDEESPIESISGKKGTYRLKNDNQIPDMPEPSIDRMET